MPANLYVYDSPRNCWLAPGMPPISILLDARWNWSESNLPWSYESPADWESLMYPGAEVRTLQTGGADFYTNLMNTVNAAPGRVVVRLPPGDFRLTSFRPIGSSGDPLYAFGFWNTKLAGFTGAGADVTSITMASGSMSQEQLTKMSTLTKASFAPLTTGIMRIDAFNYQPVFIGGVTFRSEDQNLLTAVASDITGIFVPQPAPHQGLVLYSGSFGRAYAGDVTISHVRFQGAGRALMGQPPFEMSNLTSQYGKTRIFKSEFDGRRSPDIDPAQPRRCNPIMSNNELSHLMEDVWLHHSNVSRYASNDENQDTQGTYTVRRFKLEHMSDNRNTDPALNNGEPLGGVSAVTPFGWESCNGTITLEDGIIDQYIDYTSGGQAPAHFQMTTVGSRNPQGGRFSMSRVVCSNKGFPAADGFIIGRIGNTSYWKLDGYENTIDVRHPKTGVRLTAYEYKGAWPPNKVALGALGVTPDTHYIVKLA